MCSFEPTEGCRPVSAGPVDEPPLRVFRTECLCGATINSPIFTFPATGEAVPIDCLSYEGDTTDRHRVTGWNLSVLWNMHGQGFLDHLLKTHNDGVPWEWALTYAYKQSAN